MFRSTVNTHWEVTRPETHMGTNTKLLSQPLYILSRKEHHSVDSTALFHHTLNLRMRKFRWRQDAGERTNTHNTNAATPSAKPSRGCMSRKLPAEHGDREATLALGHLRARSALFGSGSRAELRSAGSPPPPQRSGVLQAALQVSGAGAVSGSCSVCVWVSVDTFPFLSVHVTFGRAYSLRLA